MNISRLSSFCLQRSSDTKQKQLTVLQTVLNTLLNKKNVLSDTYHQQVSQWAARVFRNFQKQHLSFAHCETCYIVSNKQMSVVYCSRHFVELEERSIRHCWCQKAFWRQKTRKPSIFKLFVFFGFSKGL